MADDFFFPLLGLEFGGEAHDTDALKNRLVYKEELI